MKFTATRTPSFSPNVLATVIRLSYKCDAFPDLVSFVQFKKREKHPWMSVTFTHEERITNNLSGYQLYYTLRNKLRDDWKKKIHWTNPLISIILSLTLLISITISVHFLDKKIPSNRKFSPFPIQSNFPIMCWMSSHLHCKLTNSQTH